MSETCQHAEEQRVAPCRDCVAGVLVQLGQYLEAINGGLLAGTAEGVDTMLISLGRASATLRRLSQDI